MHAKGVDNLTVPPIQPQLDVAYLSHVRNSSREQSTWLSLSASCGKLP
jgi:hypothetical protein